MKKSRIEALGTFLPSDIVSTETLMSKMKSSPEFDLLNITGIKNRRMHNHSAVRAFEDSFALAFASANACLERSRYRAQDMDIIISASITRYKDGYNMHFEPSFGALLARALGAKKAIHFDVSNACAGMMSGVYCLDRLIKAGVVKRGMVVSGECLTPIAETAVREITEPYDRQFGSLTVGDAGAAVILDGEASRDDQIHDLDLVSIADFAKLCIGMPSDLNDSPALYTNNAEMHKRDRLAFWAHYVSDYLQSRGRSFASERYDYIVFHQVGLRMIANCGKIGSALLETDMPESLNVVADYGNTATTSHFLVLDEFIKRGQIQKGAKVLLVPMASGFVTGLLSSSISLGA